MLVYSHNKRSHSTLYLSPTNVDHISLNVYMDKELLCLFPSGCDRKQNYLDPHIQVMRSHICMWNILTMWNNLMSSQFLNQSIFVEQKKISSNKYTFWLFTLNSNLEYIAPLICQQSLLYLSTINFSIHINLINSSPI